MAIADIETATAVIRHTRMHKEDQRKGCNLAQLLQMSPFLNTSSNYKGWGCLQRLNTYNILRQDKKLCQQTIQTNLTDLTEPNIQTMKKLLVALVLLGLICCTIPLSLTHTHFQYFIC